MPEVRVDRASVTSASPTRHLADWIELRALLEPDRRWSYRDVISALRQDGSIDSIDEEAIYEQRDDSTLELIADETFQELRERADLIGTAYPFQLGDGAALQAMEGAESTLYVFLMLASKIGAQAPAGGIRLFDRVAKAAVEGYFGPRVKVLIFGHPRDPPLPRGFYEALVYVFHDQICDGRVQDRTLLPGAHRPNDDRVDIIAWLPFDGDSRTGRIYALGQCATGDEDPGDLRNKANELKVQVWEDWFAFRPTSNLCSCSFARTVYRMTDGA